MAAFCVPAHLAERLKQAAKVGEISIEKLYTMSSGERRDLFGKYVDSETAKGVNTGFEKAMASEQQAAIAKWVKNTFSSGEKAKPQYKDLLKKIDDLHKQGLLTPESEKAFLQDAVAEKLGVSVTADEVARIAEHANEIEKHVHNVSPVNTKTVEFYVAKRKMEDYIQSLTPTHNLRVFTSTIGRGAMLLSVKSPLLNIVSNSVMGLLTTLEKVIETRRFKGLNSDLTSQWGKYADEIHRKSGYDLSRFQAFDGGIKALGEEYAHSQGKGVMRAAGRFYEDIAFNKLQSRPDFKFAKFHFLYSADLSTTLHAYKEGLRGKEAKARARTILLDALSESPKTKEGQFVRAQAEADALYATYTNESVASKTALALRGVVNTATGDFRLGDITDPFVKTPANVLSAGLDYSGVTVTAKVATAIVKTLNDVAHGKEFDKTNFQNVNKYFVKAGLGLTFAFTISQMIDSKDFIGQYPTSKSEQQLLGLRNGTTNAIRVGNHWISLDYLGPLGAPLLGFLYAKKYGSSNPLDQAYRFGQGVKATLQNFPGLQTISSAYDYIKTIPDQTKNVEQATVDAGKAALGAVTSRIIPGIVSDIAKMTDTYQRQTDKNSLTTTIQSQIPELRQGIPGLVKGLPIKRTIFGDEQKTEPWLSTLLFGARVKTNQDSTLINELVKLHEQQALPAITDVSRSSPRANELKSQIGEQKFNQAMQEFGQNLKENFLDTIDSSDYEDATAQEKQNMLNKVKEETFNDILDTYGYEKPEK